MATTAQPGATRPAARHGSRNRAREATPRDAAGVGRTPPPDPARFASIQATIERDYDAGRLRISGAALAYWCQHAEHDRLYAWVMAQLDHRIFQAGHVYTNWGYLPSGAIDVDGDVRGGIAHIGLMPDGTDRVVFTQDRDATGHLYFPYRPDRGR